jgi:hypothetical protein
MLMKRKKSWLALAAGADSFRMRKKQRYQFACGTAGDGMVVKRAADAKIARWSTCPAGCMLIPCAYLPRTSAALAGGCGGACSRAHLPSACADAPWWRWFTDRRFYKTLS